MPSCRPPSCDDFEGYAAGSKPGGPWSGIEEVAGFLAVDEGRSFSGRRAMKMMLVSGPGTRRARMVHEAPGGDLVYMRAMVYLESTPVGQPPFHWNLMRVEEGSSFFTAVGGNLEANVFRHYWQGSRDCWIHGGTRFPTGRWACLELFVDARQDRSWVKVDGRLEEFTEVTDAAPLPGASGCLSGAGARWTMPAPRTLRFGLTSHHPSSNAVTLWMDDVAVSDKPIGCPAAGR